MISTIEEKREKLIEFVKKDVKGFEIVKKSESKLMKIINFFVYLFCPQFMTRFYTTVYPRLYVPDSSTVTNPVVFTQILAHEWVHLKNAERNKFWFSFKYTFPQNLAFLSILSILSIWSLWFLFSLLFLVFLVPIPAYWRAREEVEAYKMSLAVHWWLAKREISTEWVVEQFTGSNYYFMWPFGEQLKEEFDNFLKMIIMGNENELEPKFETMKNILEDK